MCSLRFVCVLLVSLALIGSPANAELGSIDNVPAATLLLPYFEVDLLNEAGPDTLFSVNNASSEPALAHITVWSEFSVPVLDFDIYLSGFDVQTISMRSILRDGVLPQTGEAVSNQGLFSDPNATFTGCSTGTAAGRIPVYNPLSDIFRTVVQEALSGQPISAGAGAGLCASAAQDTHLARGYITIDSVNSCSIEFPSSPGYFADGGTGVANNRNVLWGDYMIADRVELYARGFSLVHIEADASLGAGACDTDDFNPTTFYCRYTAANGVPGADNREALGSTWASRYSIGAVIGATEIACYRDPNIAGSLVTCGSTPFQLTQETIWAFDEEENPLVNGEGPSGFLPAQENPFPFETTKATVGEDITVGSRWGWLLLDLDEALRPGESNQAACVVVMDCDNTFSLGYECSQRNNLTRP